MKTIKSIAIVFLCIIQSCAKESHNIPCNITFKGSLLASVKSNIPLGSRIKTSLFIFNRLENPSVNLTCGVYLTSELFSVMSPTEPVILQGGLYNFFSMSFNDTSYPYINFDANYLAISENGKDYLWASEPAQFIVSSYYIKFLYKHIATKINIEISTPESFSNVHVNYVKFSLPNCSSSFINLAEGEISPSTSVLPLSELDGDGNSRTFLAIPCSAQKQIEVSIDATIAGESVKNIITRSYIDTPFTAGVLYSVMVNIESVSNSSLSISCNEWDYESNEIPY